VKHLLAIGLLLAAACDDDDGNSGDLPDDLVVDSDRIFLDGDDLDGDAGDGDFNDDALDFMDGGDVVPFDAEAGAIFFSESFIDFGVVQIGGMSVERSVELFNNSPVDVVIGQTSVFGPGFSLGATTCEMLLRSGTTCTLFVMAAPVMVGKQSGELLVRTESVTVSASLHVVGVR
jgi:hypothetical protein